MSTVFEPLQPKVILGIVAHPDDLEFTASGSIARYVAEGAQVYYLILTNANKGTHDAAMTSVALEEIRRNEQCEAGRILGVRDVFFLNYEDGALELTMALKRDIVRVIRSVSPDTVITFDPTMVYDATRGIINHSDHRVAGQAVLDAVYPLARDRLAFPELFHEEGLMPHAVSTILMTHFGEENYYVDISEFMETKLAALMAHTSQFTDKDATKALVTEWASQLGAKVGGQYAEGFVRLDIR